MKCRFLNVKLTVVIELTFRLRKIKFLIIMLDKIWPYALVKYVCNNTLRKWIYLSKQFNFKLTFSDR